MAFPKLRRALAEGPMDVERLRGLLDSKRMVQLFEENPSHLESL